jgi:hypothetical protein
VAWQRNLSYIAKTEVDPSQMQTGEPPSKRPSPRALSLILNRDASARYARVKRRGENG